MTASSPPNKPQNTPRPTGYSASVYGPVHSWRVGWSLGVDLLLTTSTCSFNCIYCQLGNIQLKTAERKLYVPTEQVEKDFKRSDWEKADIVTLSGSGEPTLALNLGEVIHFIHEYSGKPVMVLTNGTLLADPAVQRDLQEAEVVSVKLDAATDEMLARMNRPVPGVTLDGILEGIRSFRKVYTGKLCLQCMLMPTNLAEAEALADLVATLDVDEIQLNTPKRPYPLSWNVLSRGNHVEKPEEYDTVSLRTLSEPEAEAVEALLKSKTRVPVVSVYGKQPVLG